MCQLDIECWPQLLQRGRRTDAAEGRFRLHTDFAVSILLQRGRRTDAAEGADAPWVRGCRARCFNGAAARMRRRATGPRETRRRPFGFNGAAARMRRRAIASTSTILHAVSFNGAAARMRRRGEKTSIAWCHHTLLQRGRRTDAAEGWAPMGPIYDAVQLQRGRRTDAAEG